MNVVLWILQVVLAAIFLAHGGFMVAPPADMVALINAQLGNEFRLFLGVAEVLAALGLILPGITRIMPWLLQTAATGLMVVMASATAFHLVRGEYASAVTTVIIFGLTTAVTYLRWKVRPIAPRKLRLRPVAASSRM
jgi:hypothetical protein